MATVARVSRARGQTEELDARIDALLNRHACVGLALGVVRGGELAYFRADGLAEIATRTPITEDTSFRVASISKTFTAIAAMQLYERGLVDLDAPASSYLRSYRLVPARPEFGPVTLRHLLTHTAGLPESVHPTRVLSPDFGESVPPGRRLPSLAEYYRGELRYDAQPGTRFAYTNHGPATVGQIVEDVTGQPLGGYLEANVFSPLGMTRTALGPLPGPAATGYVVGRRGPRPVVERELVTAPAASVRSTLRDLSHYAVALMGGGPNAEGSVLRPETLALMFAPQYQPDPLIPGMGLAFFRLDLGGHAVVEHGGVLPGFNSEIFLSPADQVAVLGFTNGAAGAMLWLPAEVAGLLGALLGVPEPVVRTDLPQHPELWPELCGRYTVPGRLTDARARMMAGAGVQVFVRGGRLLLRGLSPVPAVFHGFELHPDDPQDPLVFRLDLSRFGMGSARIVFRRPAGAGGMALHLDVMPMSAVKRR